MSDRIDSLEDLVRRSARVRDEDLVPLADAPAAKALFEDIVSRPYVGTDSLLHSTSEFRRVGPRRRRGRSGRRSVAKIALAAALALAMVLSVPAFGVVQHVKSWLSDLKGPDEPVATAPDVVIASGVDGQRWKIVATQTDQGLCLFLLTQQFGEQAGLGGCGWASDIRGYGSADDLHWIAGGNGSGHIGSLNRIITYGVAAEDVASVELELANGRTVPADLVQRPKGIDAPLNFFWVELGPQDGAELSKDGGVLEPQLPLVHALIARDSAGDVLERRIIDEPNG
jgi:hypothetical protein